MLGTIQANLKFTLHLNKTDRQKQKLKKAQLAGDERRDDHIACAGFTTDTHCDNLVPVRQSGGQQAAGNHSEIRTISLWWELTRHPVTLQLHTNLYFMLVWRPMASFMWAWPCGA